MHLFPSYRADLSFTPDRHALTRPLHAAGLVIVARTVPDGLLSHLVPEADVDTHAFVRRQVARRATLLGTGRTSWATLWDDYVAGGKVPTAPRPCGECGGNGFDLARFDADGQLACVACDGARFVSPRSVQALPFPR